MIIHTTEKLRKKLKLQKLEKAISRQDPFLHWYATLFRIGGVQYILTTHEFSLLSFVFEGKGIVSPAEYMRWMLCKLPIYLKFVGCEHIFDRVIAPGAQESVFVKTDNRSVLGSMNDMIYHCQVMAEYKKHSIAEMTAELNEVPMGALKYALPKEVFKEMALKHENRLWN
jgi:hypothetical protein